MRRATDNEFLNSLLIHCYSLFRRDTKSCDPSNGLSGRGLRKLSAARRSLFRNSLLNSLIFHCYPLISEFVDLAFVPPQRLRAADSRQVLLRFLTVVPSVASDYFSQQVGRSLRTLRLLGLLFRANAIGDNHDADVAKFHEPRDKDSREDSGRHSSSERSEEAGSLRSHGHRAAAFAPSVSH